MSFKDYMNKILSEKINQKDYKYYVVSKGMIESGWEYEEDAKDQKSELIDTGLKDAKVLQRKGLNKLGLNPDNDKDWGNPYRSSK